jgi:hypothetical protein
MKIALSAYSPPHHFSAPCDRAARTHRYQILHDVDLALENEETLRGLLILPKVSYGVVTFTSTVISEGDKAPHYRSGESARARFKRL